MDILELIVEALREQNYAATLSRNVPNLVDRITITIRYCQVHIWEGERTPFPSVKIDDRVGTEFETFDLTDPKCFDRLFENLALQSRAIEVEHELLNDPVNIQRLAERVRKMTKRN